MPEASLEGFRLSLQQERIWQLQRSFARHIYRAQCVIEISGELQVPALQSAIANVVERHEILRTVFRWVSGITAPLQVVIPASIEITRQDQNGVVAAILNEMNSRAFDFENGPLVRLVLVSQVPGKHQLIVDLPALCADTRTLRNFARELADAYEAEFGGSYQAAPMVQYADYSQWQNEIATSEDAARGAIFWRNQWKPELAGTKIPGTRLTAGYMPRSFSVPVSSAIAAQIRQLAADCGTRDAIVLLAAWYVLLAKLSGKDEVLVAVTRDGRGFVELDNSFGLFAKSLPLRYRVRGDQRFQDEVKRVAELMNEADEWQDTFAWQQVSPSREGLAWVPFAFEEAEAAESHSAAGLTFAITTEQVCLERFETKLTCLCSDPEMLATLTVNAAAFQVETIQRLAAQFQTLLASATGEPGTAVECLNVLGEAEKRQLLIEWNSTARAFSLDECFPISFEKQAARVPDVPAVLCGDVQLTYRELEVRATQLAAYLRTLGAGSEKIIGVCLERSWEVVVALLGVLKAGAAYLPLDPTYPARRLQFMLNDSGASIVITRNAIADVLSTGSARVIAIDADWARVAAAPVARERVDINPENLAYVIYTSGSTGTPKGTLIHHRGLMNYLAWSQDAYSVAAGRGALVHSSISFDLTITGLFAPLLAGRTVRIIPEEAGIGAFGDALQSETDLSLVKLTPSHLRLLAGQLQPESAARRARAFVIGGEPLLAETLAFWRDYASDTRLFNEYGPTETVVGCCVYEVCPETPQSGPVPIGRPIANTQLYVLDSWMNPTPVGVPGELYIAGLGLARGYLNRPDLTALRFLPNPFSATPGGRMYRTGDRVCYQADGTLLFLGRVDDQVKVRGMRIELGEIEAALQANSKVSAAAACVKPAPDGESRLAAYIVPKSKALHSEQAFAAELRSFLGDSLPEYMLPSAFVVLDALPMTPNGKVDRQALPAPDQAEVGSRTAYNAPTTDAERLMTDIWSRTLGRSEIGIDDDFFALGGDSILCFQVIHRAHAAGLQLKLQQMFRFRTIRELAAAVGTQRSPQEHEPLQITGFVPLTPIQHWFFEQELPRPEHFNQAVLLESKKRINSQILEHALHEVGKHHDALRLRFIHTDTGWQQRYDPKEGAAVLDVIRLHSLSTQEQAAQFNFSATVAQTGLNLEKGPLFRAVLFDYGDEQPQRLLLVAHHLVVDGVSWRILLEDLYSAFRQLRAAEPVRLAVKTASFQRWAESLGANVESSALQEELPYWLATRSSIALPQDHNEGPNVAGSVESISIALTVEETRIVLQQFPRALQAEVAEILLAAAATAVAEWTDSPNIVVDLEGHGREDVFEDLDLSRTVGWFTSIYPVALCFEHCAGIQDKIQAVRAQLRGVPNRGIGYGVLRYLGKPEVRDQLRNQPQAEVSFNYLGQFDSLSQSEAFRLCHTDPGPAIAANAPRRYLVEIIGSVTEGQLRLTWLYSRNRHSSLTITKLAESCDASLRALIAQVRDAEVAHGSHALPDGFAAMVLVELQPKGTLPPLFCIHPSGGMATPYTELARWLGPEQPVYGFQSVGWYPDQEPQPTVEDIAASYIEVMRSVQPHGPYLLAGWSAGAIIAFEMAQRLRARGDQVAMLASIDQPPPQTGAPDQSEMSLLESMLGTDSPETREQLRRLDPDAQLTFALEHAKASNLVPMHADITQARRFLHIFRITQAAVRNYRPVPYEGNMTLLRAQDQPDAAWAHRPTFGWDLYVREGVDLHTIPGHHDNIIAEPQVRELAAKLRESISRALNAGIMHAASQ